MKGWWLVVSRWWSLVVVLVFTAVGLRAQAPGPALVSPVAVDPTQRVADLIAQSAGPYKQIALGKLALSQAFLLRTAAFNAEYDYVVRALFPATP